MSNRNTFPCPNCKRIFSTQRSLKLHLPSCRRIFLSLTECHSQIEHHPLRSFHHTSNLDDSSQCDPSHCDDDDDSEMDDFFPAESCLCSDDYDNAHQFLNEYEQSQGQQSTAASKLQIKLNNLINSHKAPIKLYDDIVDLFNEYICSDNFDKLAQLKSRKHSSKLMNQLTMLPIYVLNIGTLC